MGHWGLTSHHYPVHRHPRRDALAHAVPAGFLSIHQCLDKIVLHRHDGRDEAETIAQSILRVVENNGEVTLPNGRGHSTKHWNAALCLGLVTLGVALLIFFSLR